MTNEQPVIEVWINRPQRDAIGTVVVQPKARLSEAFERALMSRMTAGGPGQGFALLTDLVNQRNGETFKHFHMTCEHASELEALNHSLSWIAETAAQHGVAVTGSAYS